MKTLSRTEQFIFKGKRGLKEDIDFLMSHLHQDSDFATILLTDQALRCVSSDEGIERLDYYLMNGNKGQRNYSANFFRRREDRLRLLIAWESGAIDDIQAFIR